MKSEIAKILISSKDLQIGQIKEDLNKKRNFKLKCLIISEAAKISDMVEEVEISGIFDILINKFAKEVETFDQKDKTNVSRYINIMIRSSQSLAQKNKSYFKTHLEKILVKYSKPILESNYIFLLHHFMDTFNMDTF